MAVRQSLKMRLKANKGSLREGSLIAGSVSQHVCSAIRGSGGCHWLGLIGCQDLVQFRSALTQHNLFEIVAFFRDLSR